MFTKRRLTMIDHANRTMGLIATFLSKRSMTIGYQRAHTIAAGSTTNSTTAVGMQLLTRKGGFVPNRHIIRPFQP
jgi:hypothetical protein